MAYIRCGNGGSAGKSASVTLYQEGSDVFAFGADSAGNTYPYSTFNATNGTGATITGLCELTKLDGSKHITLTALTDLDVVNGAYNTTGTTTHVASGNTLTLQATNSYLIFA